MASRASSGRYRTAALAWSCATAMAIGFLMLGASSRGAPAGAAAGAPITLFSHRTTTTASTTTTTASTTTTGAVSTTTTVPSSQQIGGVAFLPCQTTANPNEPCNEAPTQLEVSYPTSAGFTAIQLVWVPGSGRPAKAPEPVQSSVVLSLADVVPCPGTQGQAGTTTVCWDWPSTLTHAQGSTNWVLNGTYDVDGCTGSTSTPTCATSGLKVGLAAPPGTPASVHTSVSGSTVTVSWAAPSVAAPDLVGYRVTRDGQDVYDCSVDGAGPGASVPCRSPLSMTDQPPTGTWTYAVSAERFGVDASSAAVVTSTPAFSPADRVVAASDSTPGSSGYYLSGPFGLPLIPSVTPGGSEFNVPFGVYPSQSSEGGATTANPTLPYSGSEASAAAASGAQETGPQNPSLDSLASIALGLIALALAVHVWFLRGELRAAAARAALRRQAAGPARP